MIDPDHYEKNNSAQRRGASETLEAFSGRIRWNRNEKERVLDVGCGDGGVTAELLREHVPGRRATLTGCDISEEMVRHANLHHKDDRTEFRVLDIAGDVPVDMVEGYDHVFSFYTLHWVKNQKKALSNLHATLVPGGDCLLTILGHTTEFQLYRMMFATDKWADCRDDIMRFISPYQDSADPAHEVTQLMLATGFREVDVQLQEKYHVYENIDKYMNFLKGVCPLKSRLSEKRYEEFTQDYIQLCRDTGLLPARSYEEDSRKTTVDMRYTMLVAYGVK